MAHVYKISFAGSDALGKANGIGDILVTAVSAVMEGIDD